MKNKIEHIINECVKTILNETINDNLHQFIKYIESSGTYGTLKSKWNNIYDVIGDVELSYAVESCLYDEFDEYCNINDIEYDEDNDSIKNKYINKRLKETIDFILNNVDINNNGLIYIERNIKLLNLLNIGNLGYELSNKYDGHLGEYWSYVFGQVIDGNGNVEISFKGWVKPEDIAWNSTIGANIMCPDEYEITLDYNTPIEIDKITIVTKRGERTIWNKPIILKA